MKLGGVVHLNRKGTFIIFGGLVIFLIYLLKNRSSTTLPLKINLKDLLKVAIKAAENGGKEVVLGQDHLKIKSKGLTKEGMEEDVTSADYLSHCSILKTLTHTYPTLKIISEENAACDPNQKIDFSESMNLLINGLEDHWEDEKDLTVWIDPLDATHEYTGYYSFLNAILRK